MNSGHLQYIEGMYYARHITCGIYDKRSESDCRAYPSTLPTHHSGLPSDRDGPDMVHVDSDVSLHCDAEGYTNTLVLHMKASDGVHGVVSR